VQRRSAAFLFLIRHPLHPPCSIRIAHPLPLGTPCSTLNPRCTHDSSTPDGRKSAAAALRQRSGGACVARIAMVDIRALL
jgi:hypothetical protein